MILPHFHLDLVFGGKDLSHFGIFQVSQHLQPMQQI